MLPVGLSKGVLGASVVARTGVGLGSAALASQGSNPSSEIEKVSSSSQSSEVLLAPKRCKLYKIESSSSGQVTRITEDSIEKELGEAGKEHYQKIKEACDNAGEGNVFLSRKDQKDWKYYSEEQNHNSVLNYLNQHPSL
ncbi:hypothetical protein MHF_0713 [Mycoplasma haemofelis Ohio2]|uniref:Uncharacterized protein n=1 Tax=Mycoplasma haemofelis (strain Ohio2) TaxID=859194 RepID=F6FID5_MYCHI|nr:hypothetical protein MHF_0713 [Mycoplasma haemofelis Ohio2]